MMQRKGDDEIRNTVEQAVAQAIRPHERVVLAVSGGRDSMVMLEAAARVARRRIVAVATFDHGTGAAATEAVALAAGRARVLGLPAVRDRGEGQPASEAGWRAARWRFLRRVAAERSAVVATAHTEDDQVETVLMRVLRDAGARGLAGLYAGGPVLRPLVTVRRAALAAYARHAHVGWVADPSNESRRFFRNRIRLGLLPVLTAARPELAAELLAVARAAAAWRDALDEAIDGGVRFEARCGEMMVARGELDGYDAPELSVLWPALAARAGVTLDRRGTRRLSAFTIQGAPGQRIQLSGGYEVVLHRDRFWLRRGRHPVAGGGALARDPQPLTDALTFGPWRFRRTDMAEPSDRWSALLPQDRPLQVREWAPGDRMVPAGASGPRRVKGLLRDAGIDAARRAGWPVVVADGEIVWIPGVRRSDAATVRSGRPAWVFVCERIDA